MNDLLIKNARIVDGTGAPSFHGSIAVKNGKITAVGDVSEPAREEIDAQGLVLMPGIIDAHTHYDAQVTWDPALDPSPALGVTTVVMGNCGFTLAPCRPEHRALLMRHFVRVEGMALEALDAGIRWDFESFPQYLDMLAQQGVGPNIATYVGHSALRAYVMGADASSRTATPDEIARMVDLVTVAINAGAVGFSSSTHEQHVGDAGVPMPSTVADDAELRALTGAVGQTGRGMLMLVKGSRTSVSYLESLVADSGRPMLVSAMRHQPTAPNKVFEELAQMEAARSRGHMLYGQCSCMPMCMDFTLLNPYPFEAFEAWRPAVEASDAGRDVRDVFRDASFRQAMKDEIDAARGTRIFRGDWAKVCVGEAVLPENAHWEGKSVLDIAQAQGKHPLDAFLDLGLQEDLRTLFTTEFSNYDVEAVGRILRQPDNQISLGDAGAHLSFLCEAGFGLHLLGHWVREQGVLSIEEAARRLTSQTADLFGMRGRGRLVPGAAADLLLFDPAQVGIGPKVRLFDLPKGASRLRTAALGVQGVWVNGVRMADKDGPVAVAQDRLPGTVMREFA